MHHAKYLQLRVHITMRVRCQYAFTNFLQIFSLNPKKSVFFLFLNPKKSVCFSLLNHKKIFCFSLRERVV